MCACSNVEFLICHFTDSGHTEALQVKVTSLEGKVSQLTRQTQLLEEALETSKAQLEARSVALQDAQNELDLAYRRLQGDGSEDRKQQKIDKLNAQVSKERSLYELGYMISINVVF